ncbi:MAG: PAS domain S-box protein, partial [Proteobacteria bacterium]
MEISFSSETANQIFFRCVEDCFEPIMITDRRGKLRYVNPAWTLVYGYSKDEVIGQTPGILRSPDRSNDYYQEMWATILDPAIGFWRGEVSNRAKDGHIVPVLLTITPYRETTGEIVGYMGIAVDLSEQKTLEQQILRQDRLASIGLLAGGLAHEIGNPLGVIQGRAELLMSSIAGNREAEKNVDIIFSQIERIAKLMQSLLRVSRVPEQVQLTEVNLKAVLEEVALLMSEALRRLQIDLRFEKLSRTLLADSNRLQQLFLNLVINATHAIEEQQQSGRASCVVNNSGRHFIEITCSEDADLAEIRVRDSGVGISTENLSKLFQPFYTTKAAGKGTGLGLAIVAKLTEEMKGSIAVTSDGVGRGATFILK